MNTMNTQSSSLRGRNINLIPTEMAVPASAVKLSGLLNKISTVLVILLILSSIGFGLSVFFLNQESNKISRSVEALKLRISDLEQNEQKLVLAKDRIEKITSIKNSKSVNDDVARYKAFSTLLQTTTGSSVSEANISSKGTEVVVISQDSTSLSSLLTPLAESANYKNIIISSLGYAQGTGFLSSLILNSE